MKQHTKLLVGFIAVSVLVTGCSSLGKGGAAKEICEARFKLVDTDPNTTSGAKYWVEIWTKASELRNTTNVTKDELAVASAMDKWFNSSVEAIESGMNWPVLGTSWANNGLKMNTVCENFD